MALSTDMTVESPAAQVVASTGRGLRIYSKIVAFSVFLLIFKGALVTSNDAGLSVPDWPTSYGHNMFLFPPEKWIGTIFYEHVHRLLASVVGILTVILTVWIFWADSRRWVRRLGVAALVTVILQGFLGGLTVLYRLPTAISAGHAVLAQTFFLITIWIAYSQSAERAERSGAQVGYRTEIGGAQTSVLWAAFWALLALYVQLSIGAVMRHAGAGIAILDFPTVAGSWWPMFDDGLVHAANAARSVWHMPIIGMTEIVLHMLHRLFGVVAVILVWRAGVCVQRTFLKSEFLLRRHAFWLMFGVVTQFALGVMALLSLRGPVITSIHVLGGALLLGGTFLLILRLSPVAGEEKYVV